MTVNVGQCPQLRVTAHTQMKQRMPAHYKIFIYSLVCFTGVAAAGVFLLALATLQGFPAAFKQDSISLIGLIGAAIWVSGSWSSIKRAEPETNPEFRRRHREFNVKAGAIITGLLFSAALAGSYFGIRAGHTAKLKTLFKETQELEVKGVPQKQLFMKLVRENTKDLPQYLQRCAELEHAINDYETSERQLDNVLIQSQQEIEALQPKASFASTLPMLSVMRALLGKDLEALKVYRKETEYAKQIPGIPQADRIRFYNANIRPVVEQERKIAVDEIEILKDAKARGIGLPESMYQEAGIS
jgi:hypothetical protein